MANTFSIASNTTSAGQAVTAAASVIIVSGTAATGLLGGNLYVEVAASDTNVRYSPAVLGMLDGLPYIGISKIGAFSVSIPAGAFVRIRSSDFSTFPASLQVDIL
jgi:hypothetical protein